MEHVVGVFYKVNQYFGKIFEQLLPGATAKMTLVELGGPKAGGDQIINELIKQPKVFGCEIKVAFNGVWKENLGELSGGQRSLLALSYLMATLKYKSAPFYILDEIDAALDLSHTENLGHMLSQNFPDSQFIIISLKEGVYKASNVLYKTGLIDGKSQVTRIINPKKST